MFFSKLTKEITVGDLSPEHLHIRYGRPGADGVFRGIQYHTAAGDVSSIYQVIPEKYRMDFSPLLMSINRDVPPHTDSGILATINLYVTSGNCETVFYRPKPEGGVIAEKLPNQTNGAIFDINSLDRAASFMATDGESYILDVTHPHGVYNRSPVPVTRRALALQTRLHKYDDVCNMLVETGFL